MKVLLLRFDAPLVSFGGPAIDHNGVVQTFPALSMLTGIIANALGWDHRQFDDLDKLQDRLRFAARIDRRGEAFIDYQTVDLGKDWMLSKKAGWTTHGKIASRNDTGTHQRWRHYRADSVHTIAVSLEGSGPPTLDAIATALREPARPLFIGRKCCLPATPLLLGLVDAPSLLAALATTPRAVRADSGQLLASWWDGDDASVAIGESNLVSTTDERDWRNQIHVGRHLIRVGHIDPPEAAHA